MREQIMQREKEAAERKQVREMSLINQARNASVELQNRRSFS